MKPTTSILAGFLLLLPFCEGFVLDPTNQFLKRYTGSSRCDRIDDSRCCSNSQDQDPDLGGRDRGSLDSFRWFDPTRRSLLAVAASTTAASFSNLLIVSCLTGVEPVEAAVGSLPELADANAILQGITVQVADQSQEGAMIDFLTEGFGFKVLRKRIRGNIEETWLGFGPEQLSIPSTFVMAVSSFAEYGGHASIRLVYDPSVKEPLYRIGSNSAPGDNIAYLQVAVPNYRMSKLVATGGIVQDAYGLVNVISPAGLPIRGIVGIWPDPMMLVAINCVNVAASTQFYQQLGFVPQDMPYSRPSQGTTMFEPAPPKGSVYLSPSANGMGILLLPTKKKALTPNRVVESFNIVYTPSDDATAEGASIDSIVDPSGISISFQAVSQFEAEEKETR